MVSAPATYLITLHDPFSSSEERFHLLAPLPYETNPLLLSDFGNTFTIKIHHAKVFF